MSIFRPPGGFKISCAPNVQALVDDAVVSDPAFKQHWKDILDRLRFTAHTEGYGSEKLKGHRIFAVASDEDRGLPRVKLVYSVLGGNVRIRIAAIG